MCHEETELHSIYFPCIGNVTCFRQYFQVNLQNCYNFPHFNSRSSFLRPLNKEGATPATPNCQVFTTRFKTY